MTEIPYRALNKLRADIKLEHNEIRSLQKGDPIHYNGLRENAKIFANPVLDDFGRANENPVASPWSSVPGNGTWKIVNQQLVAAAGGAWALHGGDWIDSECFCDWITHGDGELCLYLLGDSLGNAGYFVICDPVLNAVKAVGTSDTVVASFPVDGITGFGARLRRGVISGWVRTATQNWMKALHADLARLDGDTPNNASGPIGVISFNDAAGDVIDNFGGGPITDD